MKVLIWLLVSVFSYGQSLAEAYNIFEENGKIGLKDTDGHVLIPPAYDALGWSEGPFSVVDQVTGYKSAGRWGIIDLTNHAVTEAEFTGLLPAEGNLIIAYKRSAGSSRYLAGCLDTSGQEVIPFQYDGLTINSLRGIVYVRSGNQYKYGLIDLHNRPVIPIEYRQIQFLGSQRYAVENHTGQFALFNESGKSLTGFIFDDISRFRNKYAVVYQQQYQGIIDQNGLLRINPSFTAIELEDDGSARGRREHQWTILDASNKTLREIHFDSIISLEDNLFGIRKGSGYALVNDQFTALCPEKFSSIGTFTNHRAIISRNGRYGMIGSDGRMLIGREYLSLRQEADVVIARLPADQWVLLDPQGNRLSVKSYGRIEPYTGKYFVVKNQQYYGVMNTGGTEIISCVYDSILQYAYGKMVVQFHGEFGIIDLQGNWLVAPSPHRQLLIAADRFIQQRGSTRYLKSLDGIVIYFTENPVTVSGDFLEETTSSGGVWKIDLDGRIVSRQLPPAEAFEAIFSETEGLRGIKKDGRFGFVDNLGRLRIANRYEGIRPFREGLAAIKILGKWGFLNHDEKLVIQPVHDEVSSFDNGMAIAMQKGLYGLIDKKGDVILPIRYESISLLPSGRFELQNGNLKGLADTDGRQIFAPKFAAITDLNNGYVIVGREGKYGLASVRGLSTIPMIYDHILYDKYGDRYLALRQSKWEDIR